MLVEALEDNDTTAKSAKHHLRFIQSPLLKCKSTRFSIFMNWGKCSPLSIQDRRTYRFSFPRYITHLIICVQGYYETPSRSMLKFRKIRAWNWNLRRELLKIKHSKFRRSKPLDKENEPSRYKIAKFLAASDHLRFWRAHWKYARRMCVALIRPTAVKRSNALLYRLVQRWLVCLN